MFRVLFNLLAAGVDLIGPLEFRGRRACVFPIFSLDLTVRNLVVCIVQGIQRAGSLNCAAIGVPIAANEEETVQSVLAHTAVPALL